MMCPSIAVDRGFGVLRPLSSRPPFYSVVLSLGPLMGVDILSFARFGEHATDPTERLFCEQEAALVLFDTI
jgi:hypothetical protein